MKKCFCSSLRVYCNRWYSTFFKTDFFTWLMLSLRFWRDRARYKKLAKGEKTLLRDIYPCLYDRVDVTSVDKHYFYQGLWAMRRITESVPVRHVDVGSDNRWVGWLTAFAPVISVDVRPLPVDVKNLECKKGTVLDLPFDDNTVDSISCMHVVEHVGLGRYGDPLDPEGTAKALRELVRVVRPGGILYLSLPVGKQRVCFNAHRILSPVSIESLCAPLEMVEFSVIDDEGVMKEKCNPADYIDADYACGLFVFKK